MPTLTLSELAMVLAIEEERMCGAAAYEATRRRRQYSISRPRPRTTTLGLAALEAFNALTGREEASTSSTLREEVVEAGASAASASASGAEQLVDRRMLIVAPPGPKPSPSDVAHAIPSASMSDIDLSASCIRGRKSPRPASMNREQAAEASAINSTTSTQRDTFNFDDLDLNVGAGLADLSATLGASLDLKQPQVVAPPPSQQQPISPTSPSRRGGTFLSKLKKQLSKSNTRAAAAASASTSSSPPPVPSSPATSASPSSSSPYAAFLSPFASSTSGNGYSPPTSAGSPTSPQNPGAGSGSGSQPLSGFGLGGASGSPLGTSSASGAVSGSLTPPPRLGLRLSNPISLSLSIPDLPSYPPPVPPSASSPTAPRDIGSATALVGRTFSPTTAGVGGVPEFVGNGKAGVGASAISANASPKENISPPPHDQAQAQQQTQAPLQIKSQEEDGSESSSSTASKNSKRSRRSNRSKKRRRKKSSKENLNGLSTTVANVEDGTVDAATNINNDEASDPEASASPLTSPFSPSSPSKTSPGLDSAYDHPFAAGLLAQAQSPVETPQKPVNGIPVHIRSPRSLDLESLPDSMSEYSCESAVRSANASSAHLGPPHPSFAEASLTQVQGKHVSPTHGSGNGQPLGPSPLASQQYRPGDDWEYGAPRDGAQNVGQVEQPKESQKIKEMEKEKVKEKEKEKSLATKKSKIGFFDALSGRNASRSSLSSSSTRPQSKSKPRRTSVSTVGTSTHGHGSQSPPLPDPSTFPIPFSPTFAPHNPNNASSPSLVSTTTSELEATQPYTPYLPLILQHERLQQKLKLPIPIRGFEGAVDAVGKMGITQISGGTSSGGVGGSEEAMESVGDVSIVSVPVSSLNPRPQPHRDSNPNPQRGHLISRSRSNSLGGSLLNKSTSLSNLNFSGYGGVVHGAADGHAGDNRNGASNASSVGGSGIGGKTGKMRRPSTSGGEPSSTASPIIGFSTTFGRPKTASYGYVNGGTFGGGAGAGPSFEKDASNSNALIDAYAASADSKKKSKGGKDKDGKAGKEGKEKKEGGMVVKLKGLRGRPPLGFGSASASSSTQASQVTPEPVYALPSPPAQFQSQPIQQHVVQPQTSLASVQVQPQQQQPQVQQPQPQIQHPQPQRFSRTSSSSSGHYQAYPYSAPVPLHPFVASFEESDEEDDYGQNVNSAPVHAQGSYSASEHDDDTVGGSRLDNGHEEDDDDGCELFESRGRRRTSLHPFAAASASALTPVARGGTPPPPLSAVKPSFDIHAQVNSSVNATGDAMSPLSPQSPQSPQTQRPKTPVTPSRTTLALPTAEYPFPNTLLNPHVLQPQPSQQLNGNNVNTSPKTLKSVKSRKSMNFPPPLHPEPNTALPTPGAVHTTPTSSTTPTRPITPGRTATRTSTPNGGASTTSTTPTATAMMIPPAMMTPTLASPGRPPPLTPKHPSRPSTATSLSSRPSTAGGGSGSASGGGSGGAGMKKAPSRPSTATSSSEGVSSGFNSGSGPLQAPAAITSRPKKASASQSQQPYHQQDLQSPPSPSSTESAMSPVTPCSPSFYIQEHERIGLTQGLGRKRGGGVKTLSVQQQQLQQQQQQLEEEEIKARKKERSQQQEVSPVSENEDLRGKTSEEWYEEELLNGLGRKTSFAHPYASAEPRSDTPPPVLEETPISPSSRSNRSRSPTGNRSSSNRRSLTPRRPSRQTLTLPVAPPPALPLPLPPRPNTSGSATLGEGPMLTPQPSREFSMHRHPSPLVVTELSTPHGGRSPSSSPDSSPNRTRMNFSSLRGRAPTRSSPSTPQERDRGIRIRGVDSISSSVELGLLSHSATSSEVEDSYSQLEADSELDEEDDIRNSRDTTELLNGPLHGVTFASVEDDDDADGIDVTSRASEEGGQSHSEESHESQSTSQEWATTNQTVRDLTEMDLPTPTLASSAASYRTHHSSSSYAHPPTAFSQAMSKHNKRSSYSSELSQSSSFDPHYEALLAANTRANAGLGMIGIGRQQVRPFGKKGLRKGRGMGGEWTLFMGKGDAEVDSIDVPIPQRALPMRGRAKSESSMAALFNSDAVKPTRSPSPPPVQAANAAPEYHPFEDWTLSLSLPAPREWSQRLAEAEAIALAAANESTDPHNKLKRHRSAGPAALRDVVDTTPPLSPSFQKLSNLAKVRPDAGPLKIRVDVDIEDDSEAVGISMPTSALPSDAEVGSFVEVDEDEDEVLPMMDRRPTGMLKVEEVVICVPRVVSGISSMEEVTLNPRRRHTKGLSEVDLADVVGDGEAEVETTEEEMETEEELMHVEDEAEDEDDLTSADTHELHPFISEDAALAFSSAPPPNPMKDNLAKLDALSADLARFNALLKQGVESLAVTTRISAATGAGAAELLVHGGEDVHVFSNPSPPPTNLASPKLDKTLWLLTPPTSPDSKTLKHAKSLGALDSPQIKHEFPSSPLPERTMTKMPSVDRLFVTATNAVSVKDRVKVWAERVGSGTPPPPSTSASPMASPSGSPTTPSHRFEGGIVGLPAASPPPIRAISPTPKIRAPLPFAPSAASSRTMSTGMGHTPAPPPSFGRAIVGRTMSTINSGSLTLGPAGLGLGTSSVHSLKVGGNGRVIRSGTTVPTPKSTSGLGMQGGLRIVTEGMNQASEEKKSNVVLVQDDEEETSAARDSEQDQEAKEETRTKLEEVGDVQQDRRLSVSSVTSSTTSVPTPRCSDIQFPQGIAQQDQQDKRSSVASSLSGSGSSTPTPTATSPPSLFGPAISTTIATPVEGTSNLSASNSEPVAPSLLIPASSAPSASNVYSSPVDEFPVSPYTPQASAFPTPPPLPASVASIIGTPRGSPAPSLYASAQSSPVPSIERNNHRQSTASTKTIQPSLPQRMKMQLQSVDNVIGQAHREQDAEGDIDTETESICSESYYSARSSFDLGVEYY